MSKLRRRDFIIELGTKIGAVSAVSALSLDSKASENFEANQRKSTKLSILQGYTDSTSTEISALSHDKGMRFVLIESGTNRRIQPLWRKTFTKSGCYDYAEKMVFNEMRLGFTYILEVTDSKNRLMDSRKLKALDLDKKVPRVAYLSCINDIFLTSGAYKLWNTLSWTKCDLIFFIGDAVYADSIFESIAKKATSPKHLWKRYTETRWKVPFYFNETLTPVLAMWDDHDYGMNNGHAGRPYKKEVRDIFEAFFGQSRETECFKKGPGVSTVLHAFGQSFFQLDGRYERSSRCPFEDITINWMKANVKSDGRPTWLISGMQFLGEYHDNESYNRSYPARFKYFMNVLKTFSNRFLFVSGDIHYSEMQQIESKYLGYQTYEITSSCMHSLILPSFPFKWTNKRRLFATADWNFVWMDLVNDDKGLAIHTNVQGKEYKALWKRILKLPRARTEDAVEDAG